MKLYELVLVLRTSLSEAERKKLLTSIKSWVKDLKVTKEEEWGQKPLAYEIKREAAGHYYLFQFEGEKAIPADFEKQILASENVLRHLLLRKK